MGELKAFRIKEVEDGCPFWQAEYEVYSKQEADEVIARLKKKLDIYKRGFKEDERINAFLCKSARHQKYKRCIAMAKWCRRNRLHASVCGPVEKIDFWEKWRKRWLKIAEQFKENK